MIEITVSKKDIATLYYLQNYHPHHVVRRRASILIMKYNKTPHHQIAANAGVCENTLRNCFYDYLKKGITSVTEINFYKPKSVLKSFDAIIKAHFERYPPVSITQACAEIRKLTKTSIKNTQMRAYLKYLGMKFRKVGTIPAAADVEAQQEFHDKKLQPRIKEAKAGKRELYFVDAAHFVLGTFLGYLWCFSRIFVRASCGRQRFNVLGALNAITKKLITVTNDSYITSTQVCELLRRLAKQATCPITIVLDNARYQRCQLVMQLAQELGIELLFLPTYSPNLNLIERLWKLLKKECLYCVYYENFSLFKKAIQGFLTNTTKSHLKKLDSLLTLNFQTFTKKQIQRAI